jgi:hypothetical protein
MTERGRGPYFNYGRTAQGAFRRVVLRCVNLPPPPVRRRRDKRHCTPGRNREMIVEGKNHQKDTVAKPRSSRYRQ